MYKIIGGDHKEYGPATGDELRQWIAEGRLSGQSLVQVEGGEWKPLATFPEFEIDLRSQSGPPPQILAPPPLILDVGARALDVPSCLARGWSLFTTNLGLIFAATFLVWMIGLICQFLPLLGIFYWMVQGVFYGGLYLVILNRIRGRPAAVGDVFAGFGLGFSQLALAGVVPSFLSWIGAFLLVVPGIYLFVAWTFAIPLVADRRMEFWSAMELSRKVVARIWFRVALLLLLAFLPVILMRVLVEVKVFIAMFAAMRQKFGTVQPPLAEMLQHLPEMLKTISQTTLPLILAAKFVLLFTLPFASAALMYAYEDLFGARQEPTSEP